MPSLDIIISSYGDPKIIPSHLKLCLASIRHFTDGSFQIILERSFASASENRNNGLKKSSAPVVCFLDDDVWVTPGWNSGPLQVFRNDKTVGMIGPLVLLENGQYFSCGLRYEQRNFIPVAYANDSLNFSMAGFEPDALPTTALFVRREVIERAGFFDNDFLQCQWEDIDYYLRLRLSGYKGVVYDQSKVYHAHLFRSSTFNRNYAYLLAKWGSYCIRKISGEQVAPNELSIEISYVNDKLVVKDYAVTRSNKARKPGIFVSQEKQLILKLADALDAKAVELIDKQHYVYTRIIKNAPYCIQPVAAVHLPEALQHAVTGLVFPWVNDTGADLASPAMLASMAGQLAQFHQAVSKPAMESHFHKLPVLFRGHFFWIGGFETMMDMAAWCRKRNASFPYEAVVSTLRRVHALADVYAGLFPPEDFVFIHGDLTKDNVLATADKGDARLYLIDMEECSLGPNAYDLARYAYSLGLDSAGEVLLINQYISRYNEHPSFEKLSPATIADQFYYLKLLMMLDARPGWHIQQVYDNPALADKPLFVANLLSDCASIDNYIENCIHNLPGAAHLENS
jgi:Ser/Thr protein kinase RdoA (MazF antagonist)